MKRHDLSNMRRHAEKKYGLSNDEVYHRNNFTDDQIRTFKKSYENSKWAKEGARRAAEQYNKRHEKKGDYAKNHYNLD